MALAYNLRRITRNIDHYSPERLTPKSQFILEELVGEYLAQRTG